MSGDTLIVWKGVICKYSVVKQLGVKPVEVKIANEDERKQFFMKY